MKRKLIFEKEIDGMLNTPDDLHEIINGHVVSKEIKPNKSVSKYMSSLGKKGGKAKGKSKVRGNSEYYRRIRSMRKNQPATRHGKEDEV